MPLNIWISRLQQKKKIRRKNKFKNYKLYHEFYSKANEIVFEIFVFFVFRLKNGKLSNDFVNVNDVINPIDFDNFGLIIYRCFTSECVRKQFLLPRDY